MSTNKSLKSFFAQNSIITIGNILVSIKSIILIPIIIKSVGVTTYGAFVLLTSILGIIYGISTFGAGYRAQRFLPSAVDMHEKQKLFYTQFTFQLISILFFSFIFLILRSKIDFYIFKNEIDYNGVLIPLYLVCFAIYSQGSLYFRFTSRISLMTIMGVCFAYFDIAIIFICLIFSENININTFIYSQILSASIIAFPSFIYIIKEIGLKPLLYRYEEFTSDIKLGFPLVLNFIVEFILSGSDRYLIALYLSISDVGIYNPAYMIGSLIIIFPKAMGGTLPQLLSRAVDNKQKTEAKKLIDYAMKIFLIIGIPFVAGTIIFGKQLLIMIANVEVAEKGYLLIPIIAVGTLFYGFNLILSNVFFVKMKTNKIFKMNLIASIFNFASNFILLFIFKSIIVAAITTLISYFIAFIYVTKNLIKEWRINFQLSIIIKSIIASLVMMLLLSSLSHNFPKGLISLLLQIVLGAFIYALTLLIVKAFSKDELKFIKNIFLFKK